jgi:two-component system chemotaxis response regulator CheY
LVSGRIDLVASLDLDGRELVVVDDVRFPRLVLVKILQQFGVVIVHEAADGLEALDVLRRRGEAIACVITDLEMPRLDGLALLQKIRAGVDGVPRDLPVVVLTGHAEIDRLGPALVLDINAFLTKPISKRSVEECLGRVMGPRVAAERFLQDPEVYLAVDVAQGERPVTLGPVAPFDPRVKERHATILSVAPGSILSRDLTFPNGRLLLRAPMPLNEHLLERLRELIAVCGLPDDLWVEV